MTRWTLFFSLAIYYNGFVKRCALFYPVSVSSKAVADLLSKGEIKGMKKVLKVLGTILGIIALLLAAFLIFATTTSLKVKPTEKMEIKGDAKAKQLGQLMDLLKEEYEKGNYVIAGGDFNQTFSTTDYAKYPKMNDWVCPVIDASLYPGFQFLMDDTHPTCRSLYKTYFDSDKEHHQYYMIDGYVVSGNIEVTSLETMDLGFKNTDHNPVTLSFVLK